jgi:hypothetical protein
MVTPRSLRLAAFALLVLVGCRSDAPRELSGPRHGVLGVGASMSGRSGEGSRWSLSVVERDVRLAVDGAVVLFLDGAPDGELRFEHFIEEERWVLDLPMGVVRCEGNRLEAGGELIELKSGGQYAFDAAGRQLTTESR